MENSKSLKICVAGLGLIGGSMCMALMRAGYAPDGWNRSPEPLAYALKNGIVASAAQKFDCYDVVFVALPPKAAAGFINSNSFKNGAVVADICGVKGYIEREVYKTERNFFYVGTHPMAGKEVSSVHNACADLFDRASMVITSSEQTNEGAKELIISLTRDMGFKCIVECSAEVHDRKIAYTSQLAHIVSNAYVKDDEIESCLGFTGGSFQDMTRIAAVDPGVWAELYLSNAQNVQDKVQRLIDNLEDIKDAVASGDYDTLVRVLGEGRARYSDSRAQSFQKEGTGFLDGEIIATLLHD